MDAVGSGRRQLLHGKVSGVYPDISWSMYHSVNVLELRCSFTTVLFCGRNMITYLMSNWTWTQVHSLDLH